MSASTSDTSPSETRITQSSGSSVSRNTLPSSVRCNVEEELLHYQGNNRIYVNGKAIKQSKESQSQDEIFDGYITTHQLILVGGAESQSQPSSSSTLGSNVHEEEKESDTTHHSPDDPTLYRKKYSFPIPSITLHAVSKSGEYPPYAPSLYCEIDNSSGNSYSILNEIAVKEYQDHVADDNEGEEEGEEDMIEDIDESIGLHVVPNDASSLEAMYLAMCQAASLHPNQGNEEGNCDDSGEWVTSADTSRWDHLLTNDSSAMLQNHTASQSQPAYSAYENSNNDGGPNGKAEGDQKDRIEENDITEPNAKRQK